MDQTNEICECLAVLFPDIMTLSRCEELFTDVFGDLSNCMKPYVTPPYNQCRSPVGDQHAVQTEDVHINALDACTEAESKPNPRRTAIQSLVFFMTTYIPESVTPAFGDHLDSQTPLLDYVVGLIGEPVDFYEELYIERILINSILKPIFAKLLPLCVSELRFKNVLPEYETSAESFHNTNTLFFIEKSTTSNAVLYIYDPHNHTITPKWICYDSENSSNLRKLTALTFVEETLTYGIVCQNNIWYLAALSGLKLELRTTPFPLMILQTEQGSVSLTKVFVEMKNKIQVHKITVYGFTEEGEQYKQTVLN